MTAQVDKQSLEEFELEVAIMCGLRHPNIILFISSHFINHFYSFSLIKCKWDHVMTLQQVKCYW